MVHQLYLKYCIIRKRVIYNILIKRCNYFFLKKGENFNKYKLKKKKKFEQDDILINKVLNSLRRLINYTYYSGVFIIDPKESAMLFT